MHALVKKYAFVDFLWPQQGIFKKADKSSGIDPSPHFEVVIWDMLSSKVWVLFWTLSEDNIRVTKKGQWDWPARRFLGGPPTLSPYSLSRSSSAPVLTYTSFILWDSEVLSFGMVDAAIAVMHRLLLIKLDWDDVGPALTKSWDLAGAIC